MTRTRKIIWIILAFICAPFAGVVAAICWVQDKVAGGQCPWQVMRGSAPDLTGGLSSEAFVRKQRDEWDGTPPAVKDSFKREDLKKLANGLIVDGKNGRVKIQFVDRGEEVYAFSVPEPHWLADFIIGLLLEGKKAFGDDFTNLFGDDEKGTNR